MSNGAVPRVSRPSLRGRWSASSAEFRALRPWLWAAARSRQMRLADILYPLIIAVNICYIMQNVVTWPVNVVAAATLLSLYVSRLEAQAQSLRRSAGIVGGSR